MTSRTRTLSSLHPADKVAGVRGKSKGKKRHHSSDLSDDNDAAPPTTKRGRPQGSTNFSKEDLKKFLDIVETLRSLGNGCSERDLKSLDTKYKKTKKPTGNAKCPSKVKRAHAIEASINHHADTRAMSDSESDSSSDDDDVVEVTALSTTVHTVVARRAPSPPICRARMNAPVILSTRSPKFSIR
ncbi:hypothetical protein DFH08DRAFT_967673 [Mycena albidolilacea]|uniref:DUF6818 domain-containing protein n=1 Tax=Mycena albidolilacea TaxID=1033008 RepID=A0AAD7EJU2_9AGAR|nr:hypothetical protein DFH08DRAFT_967673 [Mycena albidolilacea]